MGLVVGCESDLGFTDFAYYGSESPAGFHSPYALGGEIEVITAFAIVSSDPSVVASTYDGATGFRLRALRVGTTEMSVTRNGEVRLAQTVEVLAPDRVRAEWVVEGEPIGDTLHVVPTPFIRLAVLQENGGVRLHGYATDARVSGIGVTLTLDPGGAPYFSGAASIAAGSYPMRFIGGPVDITAFTLAVHDAAEIDRVDFELEEIGAYVGDTLEARAIPRLADGTAVAGTIPVRTANERTNERGDGLLYRYDPSAPRGLACDVGGVIYSVEIHGTVLTTAD
jgi:hypothetical protein